MQERQKHKIAFFTNSMGVGGAERVISRLIPRLSEDFDISLILIDGSRIEYKLDVEIISLCESEKKNRLLYLSDLIGAARKLKKIVREKKIECVISFLSIPNLLNILCCKSAKNIISIRGQLGADKDKGMFSAWKNKAERALYKKADKIIVPAKMLEKDVKEQCDIIGDGLTKVIYNPIDKTGILRLSEEKMDERYIDLFDNYKVVVALGRMTKEKGYDYLLESFSRVVGEIPEARLMIIGDGSLLEKEKSLARELDIDSKVIFTGNMSNPFPYLKRASLYVLSSISEGFPNAMVEAMACGLPVVSTDCKSGPKEILSNNNDLDRVVNDIEYSDYGVLAPRFGEENSIEKYADAMKLMLTEENLLEKYRGKSLDRVDYFDIKKIVAEYSFTIYETIEQHN